MPQVGSYTTCGKRYLRQALLASLNRKNGATMIELSVLHPKPTSKRTAMDHVAPMAPGSDRFRLCGARERGERRQGRDPSSQDRHDGPPRPPRATKHEMR